MHNLNVAKVQLGGVSNTLLRWPRSNRDSPDMFRRSSPSTYSPTLIQRYLPAETCLKWMMLYRAGPSPFGLNLNQSPLSPVRGFKTNHKTDNNYGILEWFQKRNLPWNSTFLRYFRSSAPFVGLIASHRPGLPLHRSLCISLRRYLRKRATYSGFLSKNVAALPLTWARMRTPLRHHWRTAAGLRSRCRSLSASPWSCTRPRTPCCRASANCSGSGTWSDPPKTLCRE